MEAGSRGRRRRPRWRRRLRLIVPLAVLAAVAAGIFLIVRNSPRAAERLLFTSYVPALATRDHAHMYSRLDPDSRGAMSQARFAAAYRRDATVATVTRITPARVGKRLGEDIPVRMVVATRLFGTLRETVQVPLIGSGSDATVHFVP